jgi:kinetochore protein Nuf2
MGVTKDSVEPIIRAASQDQEFSDAHIDSAMLMAFYSSLSTLMLECGVRDFSLNDIFKPDSDRLRVILSNVINFLRYRACKLEQTDALIARGEQTRDAIERLTEENELLAARVAEKRAQQKREEPQTEQATRENQQLTEQLRNFKKTQTRVTNDVDKLKEEKKALVRSLNDQQFLLASVQRECSKLQPYIVDSPEQLQKAIAELAKSLQTERENVDSTERQARALSTSADSFHLVEAEVNDCIRVMEDCQRELSRQEECNRKLQRHREAYHQKETEVKEIERKEEVSTGQQGAGHGSPWLTFCVATPENSCKRRR